MKKLSILCAAIKYDKQLSHVDEDGNDKVIIGGYRHNNIIGNAYALGLKLFQIEQGFLTNYGYFVNRQEARKIALEAGQITNDSLSDTYLFSEDLY
jgi:hypothetical protein